MTKIPYASGDSRATGKGLLPPRPPSAAKVRRLVQAAFPDLSISSARFFAQGWANAAWMVNGEWLFRFPKTAEAAVSVAKEMGLTGALAHP